MTISRPWESLLNEEDRAVIEGYGYGHCAGAANRPAFLVVDVTYTFVGDTPEPTVEAIKKRRNACGQQAWDAVGVLQRLIPAARAKGLPVIYTRAGDRPDLQKFGAGALKTASSPTPPSTRNLRDGNDIVDEIAPEPGDIVIGKAKPSAFFGTPLLSYLVALKVDSLFVTGGSTSGCVRASVVDAFSNNYPCTLIADGCFDRFHASHAMTVFDLGTKYAEIASGMAALARIRALPDGIFATPAR
jgi:nicotinamidase-related amidase